MSNFQIVGSGNPIPSSTLVATDNETVFGDGSGQNPLTTNGGSVISAVVAFNLGGAGLMVNAGAPLATSTTAGQAAIASGAIGGRLPAIGLAQPIPGSFSSGGTVTDCKAQTSGEMTLTTAEWDLITGGSGGLTEGIAYYVGTGVAPYANLLSPVPPNAPGTSSQRIGVALSTTTMLIEPAGVAGAGATLLTLIPAAPDAGTGVLAGQAISMGNAAGHSAKSQATTLAGSLALGLAVAVGNTGAAAGLQIVTQGPLILPTATWDAITGDVGGLVAGSPYYVSAATAGNITKTEPVASGNFEYIVGVAYDAQTMIVKPGQVPLAHA